MRISFCFIFPNDGEWSEDDIFPALLKNSDYEWLAIFHDSTSLSRFVREKYQKVYTPVDWKSVHFQNSLLVNARSLRGVESLSVLKQKRFRIFVDDFERILLNEEILYLLLESECSFYVKVKSIESVNYFTEKFGKDFTFAYLGRRISNLRKIKFENRDELKRWLNYKKDTTNKNIFCLNQISFQSFFSKKDIEILCINPDLKINEKMILRILAEKKWNNQTLELAGIFKEKSQFQLLEWLKHYFMNHFIQWHYGV